MKTSAWSPARRLVLLTGLLATTGWGVAWYQGYGSSEVRAQTSTANVVDPVVRDQAKVLSEAFHNAAKAVLPTVVTIETRNRPQKVSGARPMPRGDNPFKGTPFEDFFGDDGQRGGTPRKEGTGSGVIIDPSGIVLTNNHVVEGADEVLVRLEDGREFEAAEIKTDPQTDLAVVRLKGASNLQAARLGDSDSLDIGDWVIAVGNPFGFDSTVSAGIISGKGRELSQGQRTRFIQTDAAINPGNSGGPLCDLNGDVIGINTAIASRSGGFQGLGFASTVNLAKWVTKELVGNVSVRRAYLGVGIGEVNSTLAQKFGVQRGGGVLIAEVFKGSPAEAAGFREGDVIVRFGGKEIHNPRDLQETVEQMTLDSKQPVEVVREGKKQTLEVVVKALPENFGRQARTDDKPGNDGNTSQGYHDKDVGLTLNNVTPREAEMLGFAGYRGVVVTDVDADSLAANAGLRSNMLVMKVGKDVVENIDQYRDAMKKHSLKEGVLLLVRTENGQRFVVIEQK